MKYSFLLLLLFFGTNIELEKRSLLDGRVEMLVPKELRWMTEEEHKIKYAQTPGAPKLVLTNEKLSVNLAFTHTTTQINDANLPEVQHIIKEKMKASYPSAEWKADGMKTINGKLFGYIQLVAERGDKTYNSLLMTELDGRLLLMSFNCAERLIPEWEPVAEKMMNSIVVTPK